MCDRLLFSAAFYLENDVASFHSEHRTPLGIQGRQEGSETIEVAPQLDQICFLLIHKLAADSLDIGEVDSDKLSSVLCIQTPEGCMRPIPASHSFSSSKIAQKTPHSFSAS